jgi:hypothetical protein
MQRRVATALAAAVVGAACDDCREPEEGAPVCGPCDPVVLLLEDSPLLNAGLLSPLPEDVLSYCAGHEVDAAVYERWLDEDCWELAAHYTARSLAWDDEVQAEYEQQAKRTFACPDGDGSAGCGAGAPTAQLSFVGPPDLELAQASPIAMLISAPQLDTIAADVLQEDLTQTIQAALAGDHCDGSQWVAGTSCTAFLVGPRHVLTARHCVGDGVPVACGGTAENRLAEKVLVFDYLDDPREGTTTVGGLTVVACGTENGAATVAHRHDWALVELDQPAPGNRTPLALPEPGATPPECGLVYAVGHPLGHPQFRSGTTEPDDPAAWIRPFSEDGLFYTTIDIISGLSGSPVLDLEGDRLVGLLVSGRFETAGDENGCDWIFECGALGCPNERGYGRAVDLSVIAAELAPHLAE